MKIYREILEAMKIDSVYVIYNDTTYMCYPLEIEDTKWIVSCNSDSLNGNIKLKVNFYGENLYLESHIIKKEQEDSCAFTYDIQINELEKNDFGILEPKKENKIVTPEDIDVIIVPGLVFDTNKNRIGYGKGFYDRFFNEKSQ